MNGQPSYLPIQLGPFGLGDLLTAYQPATYLAYMPQPLPQLQVHQPQLPTQPQSKQKTSTQTKQQPPQLHQTQVYNHGWDNGSSIAAANSSTTNLQPGPDESEASNALAAWKFDDLVSQLLGTGESEAWGTQDASPMSGAGDVGNSDRDSQDIFAGDRIMIGDSSSGSDGTGGGKSGGGAFGASASGFGSNGARWPKQTLPKGVKEAVWTGTMPVRVYKNATFSQKLFVGGLPMTMTPGELQKAFSIFFGNVRVIVPKSRAQSAGNLANGYCHIVVKNDKSVKRLLNRCQKSIDNPHDTISMITQSFEYFHDLPLSTGSKRVQVIPWCINDSYYTNQMNSGTEKYVAFVGALHGIMTAEFVGRVMSDLFGHIEFVSLDTDRFDYPIGSARVGFTNREAFLKAIKTNFVKIKTSRFSKVVQIEPFLEDSACSVCSQRIGVNFCKSEICFRYYCTECWEQIHACLDSTSLQEHQCLNKKRQEG